MKALLELVVKALVAHPDQAEVALVDGRRATRFEIRTPAEDRGQVIGKDGMTIRSLRVLADISAHKHRRRFEIELPD
jgi:predicted RNA-binding protein YlqC (UPF0109 family)